MPLCCGRVWGWLPLLCGLMKDLWWWVGLGWGLYCFVGLGVVTVPCRGCVVWGVVWYVVSSVFLSVGVIFLGVVGVSIKVLWEI